MPENTIGKKIINLNRYYRKDRKGNEKFYPCLLAKDLLFSDDGNNIGIHVVKETRDVLVWNKKYYEYDNEKHSILKTVVQDKIDYLATNSICEEVVGCMLRIRPIEIAVSKLNKNSNLINLNNGVYGISSGTTTPHDKSFMFTTCLNIDYNKDAICPKFLTFLGQVIKPEDADFMQEVFGYCFYLDYKFPLYLFLIGGGRNGKGTVTKVLKKLFGSENISAVTPQQLAEDKFIPAELLDKYVNLAGDVSNKTIKDSSLIKCATGGDEIIVQSKFGKPFKIVNTAKFISATNEPPNFLDATFAMKERLKFIDFPNKFPDGDLKTNPDILEEITTPEELSGIFNWAMIGLKRLLQNKKFSYSKSTEESWSQYYVKADSVGMFNQEFFEDNDDEQVFVQKAMAFNHYKTWCNVYNVPPKNYELFCEQMKKKSINGITSCRPKINGKQIACWRGIRWRLEQLEDEHKENYAFIPKEEKTNHVEKQTKLAIPYKSKSEGE